MKIDKILVIASLIMIRVTCAYSQHVQDEVPKSTSGKVQLQQMLGKPTGEQLVDGLKVQFWVLPQEDHEKMMQETQKDSVQSKEMQHGMMHSSMKDSAQARDMHQGMMGMMGMKHSSSEHADSMMIRTHEGDIMSGTHHLMIVILDAKTGLEVSNAEIQLHILTPLQNHFAVELSKMKNHYGAGITFNEKGQYKLYAQISKEGKEYQADFTYEQK